MTCCRGLTISSTAMFLAFSSISSASWVDAPFQIRAIQVPRTDFLEEVLFFLAIFQFPPS